MNFILPAIIFYFIFVGLVGKEKYDPNLRFFPLGPIGGIASIIGLISIFYHFSSFNLITVDKITYYCLWIVFINCIITTVAFLAPLSKTLNFGFGKFLEACKTFSIFSKIVKILIGIWLLLVE